MQTASFGLRAILLRTGVSVGSESLLQKGRHTPEVASEKALPLSILSVDFDGVDGASATLKLDLDSLEAAIAMDRADWSNVGSLPQLVSRIEVEMDMLPSSGERRTARAA